MDRVMRDDSLKLTKNLHNRSSLEDRSSYKARRPADQRRPNYTDLCALDISTEKKKKTLKNKMIPNLEI